MVNPVRWAGFVPSPPLAHQHAAKGSASITDRARDGGAHGINEAGEVVRVAGLSDGSHSAFLWQNGGPMVDPNTLIPAHSALHLVFAESINDRGEIGGTDLPPGVPFEEINTRGHAFLLLPICD